MRGFVGTSNEGVLLRFFFVGPPPGGGGGGYSRLGNWIFYRPVIESGKNHGCPPEWLTSVIFYGAIASCRSLDSAMAGPENDLIGCLFGSAFVLMPFLGY